MASSGARPSQLPAVVIACASEDRKPLVPAFKRLGSIARLSRISGMHRSEARAKFVVSRCGTDAVYVVVRSEHLDTAAVQRSLNGLRAQGVEAHNLVVADFATGDPLSIVAPVRGALERRLEASDDGPTAGLDTGAPDPDQTQPFTPTPEQLRRRAEQARAVSWGEATAEDLDSESRAALDAAALVARKSPSRGRLGVVAAVGVAVIAIVAGLAASGVDAPSESVAVASVTPTAVSSQPDLQPEPKPEPTAEIPDLEVAPPPAIQDLDVEEDLVIEPIDEVAGPVDVHAVVMQGLRSRELRAYDGLVFTAEPLQHKVHYRRASAYCRNYEFEGIDDWRLPSAGELASLGEVAAFGRRDRIWSSTKGEGRTMLAYDARKEELVMKDYLWRGGRAICVRGPSSES